MEDGKVLRVGRARKFMCPNGHLFEEPVDRAGVHITGGLYSYGDRLAYDDGRSYCGLCLAEALLKLAPLLKENE